MTAQVTAWFSSYHALIDDYIINVFIQLLLTFSLFLGIAEECCYFVISSFVLLSLLWLPKGMRTTVLPVFRTFVDCFVFIVLFDCKL